MIYLLEDDDSIRKLVIYGLESQGYAAKGFALPSEFWRAMGEALPELVLLDIMLPEEDGLSVLRRLRKGVSTRRLPVIMLTAKNAEYDRVITLDNGADDFVSKPFGMMELVSCVKAVLRRCQSQRAEHQLTAGDIKMDLDEHTVAVGGQRIALTYKEFELLCLLAENQGLVLTRGTLMDKIWGLDCDRENRTLDVHIRTLRVKLGEAGSVIETIRGVGYKIGGGT